MKAKRYAAARPFRPGCGGRIGESFVGRRCLAGRRRREPARRMPDSCMYAGAPVDHERAGHVGRRAEAHQVLIEGRVSLDRVGE